MKNKKLNEIAEITFCTVTPSRSKPSNVSVKWLMSANFYADNIIEKSITVNNVAPDENWLLQKDDIVIKRITPAFVNYIDSIEDGIYCGNNLIIVKPSNDVDAKYLAMMLNEQIGNLSEESSVGAVMKSISKSDLENISIPFLDMDKQKAIGMLWYKGIELKKKKVRLAELENLKTNYYIKKTIKMCGGKDNG